MTEKASRVKGLFPRGSIARSIAKATVVEDVRVYVKRPEKSLNDRWCIGTVSEVRFDDQLLDDPAALLTKEAAADIPALLRRLTVKVQLEEGGAMDVTDPEEALRPFSKWATWDPKCCSDFCATRFCHDAACAISLRTALGRPGAIVPVGVRECAFVVPNEEGIVPPVAAAESAPSVFDRPLLIILNETEDLAITKQLVAARSRTPDVMARFAQYMRLIEFLCGSAHCLVETVLDSSGELFMRPWLWSSTVCKCEPMLREASGIPRDVEEFLVDSLSIQIDAVKSLFSACAKLNAFAMSGRELRSAQAEELASIAAMFGIQSKSFHSHFYPMKGNIPPAAMEEAKNGIFQAALSRIVSICFKTPVNPKSAPLMKLLSVPSLRAESGGLEEFLQTLIVDGVAVTAAQRLHPSAFVPGHESQKTHVDCYAPNWNVVRQWESLKGSVAVIESAASTSPTTEALVAKMQEVIAKAAASDKAGALDMGATSRDLQATLQELAASSPAMDLGATFSGGGVTLRGSATSAGFGATIRQEKKKDKDYLVVNRVCFGDLPDSDRVAMKYRPSVWLAMARALQLFPIQPPSFCTQFEELVHKYLRAQIGFVVVLHQADWQHGDVLAPMELARAIFYTPSPQHTRRLSDISPYRSVLKHRGSTSEFPAAKPPAAGPKGSRAPQAAPEAADSSAPQLTKSIFTCLCIAPAHYTIDASSAASVVMSPFADSMLSRKLNAVLGAPVTAVQSACRAKGDALRCRILGVRARVIIVQQFVFLRRAELKAQGRGIELSRSLYKRLRVAQRGRVEHEERVARDATTTDEENELRFIVKRAGSFLRPLFARMLLDCCLLEMNRRVELGSLQLQQRQRIFEWYNSKFVTLPEERRARELREGKQVHRLTEPLVSEETIARCSLAHKAMSGVHEIERAAVGELRVVQQHDKQREDARKIERRAQRRVQRELAVAAQRRNAEELRAHMVLLSPQRPYNLSYEMYWGQQNSVLPEQANPFRQPHPLEPPRYHVPN